MIDKTVFDKIDYFQLLGIDINSNAEEIKRAYRNCVKKYHPDVFPGDKEDAEYIMSVINNAYSCLSDPYKLAEYRKYIILKRESEARAWERTHYEPYGYNSNRKPENQSSPSDVKKHEAYKYVSVNFIIFAAVLLVLVIAYVVNFAPEPTHTGFSEDDSVYNEPSESDSFQNVESESYKPILLPEIPPDDGVVSATDSRECLCPFRITVPSGESDYYLTLKNITDGYKINIYLSSGNTMEIAVPLGVYKFIYCCGKNWYGYEHLFGDESYYYTTDDTFNFYKSSTHYCGHSVELIKQENGNMEEKKLTPEQYKELSGNED